MRERKIYNPGILMLCLMLLITGNYGPGYAQSKPALEYQVKAAFLFNFTRFIHWPASAYSGADAPFVIGVVGEDPFGTYIDDLVNGEMVDGHRITVRRYPDGSDLHGCQMVFINNGNPAQLKAIVAQASQQKILTVSDQPDFTDMGGVLRFYKQDNKIKIEIGLNAAKAADLEISAKLLQLARVK